MRVQSIFASLILLLAAGACAQGATIGEGGAGGFGGAQDATTADHGATTATGAQSTSAGPVTTGAGVTTTSQAATGSTSAGVTSSSSGLNCGTTQHVCNAACADNTIATGCYGSATCAACPAAPTNGTEICSATGQCDVTCGTGYNHVGNACVCATMCCVAADCPNNEACNNGTCQGTCDSTTCAATCAAACLLQSKLGVGACSNGVCGCVCL